jgi:hypothetical protein
LLTNIFQGYARPPVPAKLRFLFGDGPLPIDPMSNQIQRRGCLCGLVAACLVPPHAGAVEPAGAVEAFHGDCYAMTAAVRRTLERASSIFVGDTVGTGTQSSLGLHLGAATEVRLGAEAKLRIDRFLANSGGVLVLERGALLYDHDPSSGPDQMTIRSPFGLMAVRGTRFFAGPSDDVFGVFIERGSVMVVGRQTAVLVTAGLGTNIAHPGAEPTDPAPWGEARIARARASAQ